MLPLSACNVPPTLFKTSEAVSALTLMLLLMLLLMLILPAVAAMSPLLVIEPRTDVIDTFCAAVMIEVLTIEPPAVIDKLPEEAMVPLLMMLLTANKFKLSCDMAVVKPGSPPAGSTELKFAPARLLMLFEMMLAEVTVWLVDSA